jgi:hypothetical protein
MTVPALEDEAQWRNDTLLSILGTRQEACKQQEQKLAAER